MYAMLAFLVFVKASLLKAQIKIRKRGSGTKSTQIKFMNKEAVLAIVLIYGKSLDKEILDSITYI